MSIETKVTLCMEKCIKDLSHLLNEVEYEDAQMDDSLEDQCGRLKIIWQDLSRTNLEEILHSSPSLYKLALLLSENLSRAIETLLLQASERHPDPTPPASPSSTNFNHITQSDLASLTSDIEVFHRFAQHTKRLLLRDASNAVVLRASLVHGVKETTQPGSTPPEAERLAGRYAHDSPSGTHNLLQERLLTIIEKRRNDFIQRLMQKSHSILLFLPYIRSYWSVEAWSGPLLRHGSILHTRDQPPQFPGWARSQNACCPFCLELLSTSGVVDIESWYAHIQSEFKPYICVFDGCETPTCCFGRIEEWIAHMKQNHSSQQWRCASRSHMPQLFTARSDFEAHMRLCHAKSCPEQYLHLISERCACRQPIRFQKCPLCRCVLASDGIDHIARHLRSIACRSLDLQEIDETVAKDRIRKNFLPYRRNVLSPLLEHQPDSVRRYSPILSSSDVGSETSTIRLDYASGQASSNSTLWAPDTPESEDFLELDDDILTRIRARREAKLQRFFSLRSASPEVSSEERPRYNFEYQYADPVTNFLGVGISDKPSAATQTFEEWMKQNEKP